MNTASLKNTAKKLVAPYKGILAADESLGTIEKRFKSIGISSTETNRRDYRQLLFTSPGVGKFISGAILFDETIRQKSSSGKPLAKLLSDKGVIPGIKVDKKAHDMAGFPGEKITEGLDGLRDRLIEYSKLGAKFAKWRAVITINKGLPAGRQGIPTQTCIDANAQALARYAALCQEAGIVPIVEPEVLMDGNHSITRNSQVTKTVLDSVFLELEKHRVLLEGILLKPNMVIYGENSPKKDSVEVVAKQTVSTFKKCIPHKVPGIVFLSGGQSPDLATKHLNAINQTPGSPWQLSFSYGRALQNEALATWKGKKANLKAAQQAFIHRAQLVSTAREGKLEAN